MKKIVIICAAILIGTLSKAQNSPVDELFEKYSERDGFTTVTISGKLLSLFTGKGNKDEKGKEVINRLTSIKILSVEDSVLNLKLNFYNDLSREMDFSAYEELMSVKEGRNTTKFLIRQKGDIISELIMISGGPSDNTLISIRGDLDLKSLSELSKETGIKELQSLENVDKKKQH